MRIIVVAPDRAVSQLRAYAGSQSLVGLTAPNELGSALRGGDVRWTVIDLHAFSEAATSACVDLALAAGVRIAITASIHRADMRRIAAVCQTTLPEVILRETDDDWARLAVLFRRDSESVAALILSQIAPRIAVLRAAAGTRIAGLFAELPIPDRVATLARTVGQSEAWLRAELDNAGFASPHELLDGARLTRAWESLGKRGAHLDEIADAQGFGTGRTLERRCKDLVGMPPRRAGRTLGAADLARILARRLTRG
jgi:AraC-like DNA-binding protein